MRLTKLNAAILLGLIPIMLLSGCTNWKKKYQGLNVEYQNLKGLLERERAEKGQLSEQMARDQQTIADLQKRILDKRQSAAEATGFGEGYDVVFDAAAGTVTVTLPNAILFSSGKANLRSASSKELDHIYSVLRERYGGKEVE